MMLVIAYGNRLREDDGFGPVVAERLLAAPVDGVRVLAALQLLPEMVEDIAAAGHVVFVDAAVGSPPGVLRCEALSGTAFRQDAHSLDPAGLLALTATLYGQAPPATLLTVTGARWDYGEALSPGVEAAVAQAVDVIAGLVA